MPWLVVDQNNIIQNHIVYDGKSPYNPGPNLSLVEIEPGLSFDIGWKYENGIAVEQISDVPPVLPTTQELMQHAASTRYTKEVSGTTIGELQIPTDRQTQATVTGIITLMNLQPTLVIKYKTESGFITANQQTMMQIALTIANHVQTCFAKEAEVVEKINTNAITTYEQIDQEFA